jgi:hypothetical protein
MADAGTGLPLTGSPLTLLITFGASVLSFVAIFMVLVHNLTNEVVIARRCIMFARAAVLAIVVCHGIQLSLDSLDDSPIGLPSLRMVRPIAGLVLMFLAFFVSSHQIFRWLVVLFQPLWVVSATYTAATWAVELACRDADTCLKQSGYSRAQVQELLDLQYASIFFEIWLILGTVYLLICMGACHSRYPVRLFSITKPLSQVPAATAYVPIERFAVDSAGAQASVVPQSGPRGAGFGARTNQLLADSQHRGDAEEGDIELKGE